MYKHQDIAELFCLVCNENTEHVIHYIDDSIETIACSKCSLCIELVLEISINKYFKLLIHRLLTKTGRLLDEIRKDLLMFTHSFPLRVITKPYRLLNEIKDDSLVVRLGGKAIDTEIFCLLCNESTKHKMYYYNNTMYYSKCDQCGLKIEFVSLVISVSNYQEEIVHRVFTKPERLLEELNKNGPKLFYAIPLRIVTKPYRIFREFYDRLHQYMERSNG